MSVWQDEWPFLCTYQSRAGHFIYVHRSASGPYEVCGEVALPGQRGVLLFEPRPDLGELFERVVAQTGEEDWFSPLD